MIRRIRKALMWPWTPWVDIMTFSWAGDSSYLVQGRRNSITNAKQFRTTRCDGQWFRVVSTPLVDEAKLTKAGLFIAPNEAQP